MLFRGREMRGQRRRTGLFLLLVIGGALLAACAMMGSPALPSAPPATPTPTPALVFAPHPTARTRLIWPTGVSRSPTRTPTATPRARVRRIDRTLNILVLGADRRSSKAKIWRTDTIMLVMVDERTQEVAVISIPRDTYVHIPGYGYQRINVVDYFGESGVVKVKGGGPALLKAVFRENFGVRVDHYVRIDLPGFAKVVDVLGGVDVEITCPHTVHWGGETYHFKKGKQHLSGAELIIYVRARRESNDIDRARRQQRAILAMRDRARELNLLPRLPSLYATLRGSVQTDLSLPELLRLARLAMNIPPDRVHGKVIGYPLVRGTVTQYGEAVLVPDLPAIRKVMEQAFEQPPLLEATEEGIACEKE